MSEVKPLIVPHPRKAGLISALILTCLGIQAVISIALLPVLHGTVKTTWPFVNYGMYCQAHREGDLIPKRVILGVRKDGSQVTITSSDLGWNNWFYQLFADAILNNDRTIVTSFLRQGPGTRDTQWISLRVVERGTLFCRTGQVQVPEKELGIVRLESPRTERQ